MRALILSLLAGMGVHNAHSQADAEAATPRAGLLQLLDGSSLHGSLGRIDSEDGLVWSHPAATGPIQLRLTNLSNVRFEHAEKPVTPLKSTCRFLFKNGDEIVGNIRSMQGDTFEIESWFGQNVQANPATLDTIMFSANGYNLVYEGPNGTAGWRLGRNPRSWEYRDGAFIANGADSLGRDFGLKGSSTLEFDLQWTGSFSLAITLYSSVIDRFDYSTSAYQVYLGTGAVSVQRVQAGAGAMMLGQTQIPEMLRRNKMKFEIRCNKDDATISLLADRKFIAKWRDNGQGGFVAKGGGIIFFSQVEPGGLKLSNIRVAEWDGKFEPEAQTNAPPEFDAVFLANRDKVVGKIQSMDDQKVTIETKQTRLDIPSARITQVRFARGENSPAHSPREVRATFPGGEAISFELHEWDARKVAGLSSTFGPVSFDSKNIRQLQFNLHRSSPSRPDETTSENEFPELE